MQSCICTSSRSSCSEERLNLDLGSLDLKRLNRLAVAMHLDANLTIWRDRNVGQEA
jgi:hypothetical protein